MNILTWIGAILFYAASYWLLWKLLSAAWTRWKPGSSIWEDRYLARLVVSLALVRLLMIISMPLNGNESGGDAFGYYAVARQFLPAHLMLATGYAFLAGLFLKAAGCVIGISSYALLVAQHALGLLTAAMMYQLLKPSGQRIAFWVALTWGLSNFALLSEHVSRPEFLINFIFLVILYLLINGQRQDSRDPFLLSLATGWGCISRANFLVVVPGLLLWMLLSPGQSWTNRWRRIFRFSIATPIVYATFILLIHWPATGSFKLNWGLLAGPLQSRLEPYLSLEQDPEMMNLIRMHYLVGRFLQTKIKTREDLPKWIPYPARAGKAELHPKELQAVRAEFQDFVRHTPVDSSALIWTKQRDWVKYFPFENSYLADEGVNALCGIDVYDRLWRPICFRAIGRHWPTYLKSMADDFPSLFGFGAEKAEAYMPPPLPNQIHSMRKAPLSFSAGYREDLANKSNVGVYWGIGIQIIRAWTRWMAKILPCLLVMTLCLCPLFLLFLAVIRHPPKSGWLLPGGAFVLISLYVSAFLAVSVGAVRYGLPVYPLIFIMAGSILGEIKG